MHLVKEILFMLSNLMASQIALHVFAVLTERYIDSGKHRFGGLRLFTKLLSNMDLS
jgi:hypothetical protein